MKLLCPPWIQQKKKMHKSFSWSNVSFVVFLDALICDYNESKKTSRECFIFTSIDQSFLLRSLPSVLACRLERGCPTRELPWAPPAHRTEGARRCGPACPPRWWSPAVRGPPPPSRSSSSSSSNSSSSSSRPSRTGPESESEPPSTSSSYLNTAWLACRAPYLCAFVCDGWDHADLGGCGYTLNLTSKKKIRFCSHWHRSSKPNMGMVMSHAQAM